MRNSRIILLFTACILISFGIFWKTLTSDYLKSKVAETLTQYLEKEYNAKISFKEIEINAFPPGVSVKSVVFEYEKNNYFFHKIGIVFNVIDLLANKISIKNFNITGFEYQLEESFFKKRPSNKAFKAKFIDVRDGLFNFLNEMPVFIRSVSLSSIKVYDNDLDVNFNIELTRDRTEIDVSLDLDILRLNCGEISCPDKVSSNFIIKKDHLYFEELKVLQGIDSITYKGELGGDFDESLKDIKLNGAIYGYYDLNKLSNLLHPEFKGFVNFEGKVNGLITNPNLELRVRAEELASQWYEVQRAEVAFDLKQYVLNITRLKVFNGNEEVALTEHVPFFDFKNKEFLTITTKVDVKRIKSKTALFVLRKELSPLSAELAGTLELFLDYKILRFKLLKDFSLSNIVIKDDKRKTLDIPLLKSELAFIEYDFIKNEMNAGGDVYVGESGVAKFKGNLNEEGVNFFTDISDVNFIDIGKISELQVDGVGRLEVATTGKWDNIIFDINYELQKSRFLGFLLGDSKGNVKVLLEKNHIKLTDLRGDWKDTRYTLNGLVDFNKKDDELNINLRFLQTSLEDSLNIFKPIIKTDVFSYFNIAGGLKHEIKLLGGLSLDKLKVKGLVTSPKILLHGETFYNLLLDYKFESNYLDMERIVLEKERGRISGGFAYDFIRSFLDYKLFVQDVYAEDVDIFKKYNVGLEGNISGDLSGAGTQADYKTETNLNINNITSNGVSLGDSWLKLFWANNKVELKSSFFSNELNTHLLVDYRNKNKSDKNSFFKFNFNSEKMNELITLFSDHAVSTQEFYGASHISIDSKFNAYKPEALDLELFIRDMVLSLENTRLKYSEETPQIVIENGKIVTGNVDIKGNNFNFYMKGSGDVGKKYNLSFSGQSMVDMVRVVSSKFRKLEGVIDYYGSISGDNGNHYYTLESKGKNITFEYDGMPGRFENMRYSVDFKDSKFNIEYLTGFFAGGEIFGDGIIEFKGLMPLVSLNLNVNDSKIEVLKKNFAVINGRASINGSSPPYNLNGDFKIVSSDIRSEFNEFNLKKSISDKYTKYIPEALNTKKLINLNIKLASKNDITMKNSLLDFVLGGEVSVIGSADSPKLEGKLSVLPGLGKILFKSYDFNIKKGDIYFYIVDNDQKLRIDFSALSEIKQYKVSMIAKGTIDDLIVTLKSDPFLSQKSIVSLLAFGYTEDESKDIDETSRESLASLSIGNILFDRFKINEELQSSLGLKLSIQPELVDSEDSLLDGRSKGSSGASRTKTATKLKVQKKINESIDLSVSSTFGVPSEQKQEMNLDYEINKNILLQGVFEIKENTESQEGDNQDSAGADIKFRWTFD